MQLQPHGCARHAHWRGRFAASVVDARGATRFVQQRHRASGARRRRQFGCSLTVPGRFGCSSMPKHIFDRWQNQRRPSGGSEHKCGINNRWRVLPAVAPRLAPMRRCRRTRRHNAARSAARSSRTSASWTPTPSRPQAARVAMSLPRHQPATVGRSCVDVMPTADVVPGIGRGEAAYRIALEPQHAHAMHAGAFPASRENHPAPSQGPRRQRPPGGASIPSASRRNRSASGYDR